MTTFKAACVAAALFVLAPTATWCQQTPSVWTWSTESLKDLSPSQSSGGWTVSLPKMLVKGWDQLVDHRLSEAEWQILARKSHDQKVLDLKRQHDQKSLERARATLAPRTDLTALAAIDKALGEIEAKLVVLEGESPGSAPNPVKIPLKSAQVSESSNTVVPALYHISGTLRTISGYLQVVLSLSSTLEDRELARWEGTFSPDEAGAQMQLARQKFLEVLLGRPWSGLRITSEVSGTVVDLGARGRVSIPWVGEDLEPGPLQVKVFRPGTAPELVETVLEPTKVVELALATPVVASETIRLETSPPDAAVWLDSRWLGHSPLQFEVPLQLSRLRYELDGYAGGVVEVGPASPRFIDLKLTLPGPLPDPVAKRDQFYWSVAALTGISTATFFLRDGADQQLRLVNSYFDGENSANYTQALFKLNVLWYSSQASIALTAGVFVWMMFTLGDYLSAAQTQLP